METLGMSLAEGKAVLKGVQEFVAEQQAAEFLQRERTCRNCARHLSSKGAGSTSVRTVFGPVRLPNPRWNQCDCQSTGKGSFRPLRGWLCGQTTPELLYLEVRWASLIPYRGVARLLEDVLPVAYTQNGMTIRNHVLELQSESKRTWARRNPCSSMAPSKIGKHSRHRTADDRWHRWRLCPGSPQGRFL